MIARYNARFSARLLGYALITLLPLAITLALALDTQAKDISCPSGTEIVGCAPPDCTERGCQKRDANGNQIRHGTWIVWYINGQKQSEGEYVNGVRNGKWTWWYPNGVKRQQGKFWDGRTVGQWSYWDENGKLDRNNAQRSKASTNSGTSDDTSNMEDFARNLKKGFKTKP